MDAAGFLETRFRDSADDILLHALDGRRFSYGQYWANARAIAETWRKAGVPRGAAIAFLLPNGPSVLACYLACAIGGHVACPIIPSHGRGVVEAMLRLIAPALVVRDAPPLDPDLAAPRPADLSCAMASDERFMVLLTSGTTGRPKGICHSLQAMLDSARAFAALSAMDRATRLYHVLPMGYMAGLLNTMLAPLAVGGTIIEGPAFSAARAMDFWPRPVETEANFLTLVPSAAAALAQLSRDREAARGAVSGLAQIQCTAGQLQSATRRRFLEAFGRPLQDCYGLTELGGPLTTQSPAEALTEEHVGRPVAGLETRLVPGALGDPELWIRSPFAMEGYLTEDGLVSPFDAEGFMATGDLARIEDGKIHITGRSKDSIVRGGVNVAPVLIENRLGECTEIQDVAVVGLPDAFWGEIVVACVIPAPSADPEAVTRKLFAHCGRTLDPSLRPDRIVALDSFPRAGTGKVQKHALRQQLAERQP